MRSLQTAIKQLKLRNSAEFTFQKSATKVFRHLKPLSTCSTDNQEYTLSWLALITLLCGMSGSILYIYNKINVFHLGLVPAIIFIYYSLTNKPELRVHGREIMRQTVILVSICFVQLLWIPDFKRWLFFLTCIAIGTIYFTFARLLIIQKKLLRPASLYLVLFLWLIVSFAINSTASSFGNINDVAVSLVILLLLYGLYFEQSSTLILTLAALFTVYFDRRAAYLALFFYLISEGIYSFRKGSLSNKKLIIYVSIVLTSLAYLNGRSRGIRIPESNPIAYSRTSEGIRINLLEQMETEFGKLSAYQIALGQGLGQLNLTNPLTGQPWSSPHFFWIEIFFFIGVLWPLWLGIIFLRTSSYGKICSVTILIAGVSMSSMIYFMPFYILLGCITGTIRSKQS